ncbi:hypothetical protein [Nonomuraea sp. NPDC050202]
MTATLARGVRSHADATGRSLSGHPVSVLPAIPDAWVAAALALRRAS